MVDSERCQRCGTPRALAPESPSCITCGTSWPRGPAGHPEAREPAATPALGAAQEPGGPEAAAPPASGTRRRLVYVALGTALALVAGALAFVLVPRGAEERAWALRFTPGQELRYRLRMSMEGALRSPKLGVEEPADLTLQETIAMRVLSVDSEGTATVEVRTEDVQITANDLDLGVPPDVSVKVRIARDGRVLSAGGLWFATGGSQSFGLPGLEQFTPVLPDQAVEPGDTWTEEFEVPFPYGDGVIRYRTENRLLRYEEVEGVRAAVVESRMRVPFDFTLSLREMFEALGESPGGPRHDPFLGEFDPRMAFRGSQETVGISWFAPGPGQLLRMGSRSRVDMRVRFEGFPSEVRDDGEFGFRGTVELQLDRLP